MITSQPLGGEISDATQRSYSMAFKDTPLGGRAIFNVTQTDKRIETFNSSVIDQFAGSTGDGDNFILLEPTNGDELILTQSKVTASIEVTDETEHYDQYNVTAMLEGAAGIGTSTAKRIELDLQQGIKNGATGSYTDRDGNAVVLNAADGVAWFSNSHTVNGSSSTYDNTDSTAFGQTGLETMENLFRQFLNHDGQRITRRPNMIFSTGKASLINLIREYNKGMNHIEDANRGINAYQGKYDSVVLEYLDATIDGANDGATDDYWGLAVAKDKNLKLRVSREPVLYAPQLVQRNRNILIQGEARYAYGLEDPNCIGLSTA